MTVDKSGVQAYRFGTFELRPRDLMLTRDGAPVKLSPKAFDTLRILLDHHGELVAKDELIAAVWPATVVEESNLAVHISAIRKLLESAGIGEHIETVPKRGYRFRGPVEVVRAKHGHDTPADGDDATPSIAVVPLKILSGHPDTDFLAFALPDAVAASLAERTQILVRSPLAAAEHGGADANLTTVANALRVRCALTGTLGYFDGVVAANLRLLSVPAGVVMWAGSYRVMNDGLFELQDTVAGDVADALARAVGARVTISRREGDRPKGTAAYAFYLRANQLAYEVRNWLEARDLYRASVDADPDYAPAWARLGRCERLIGKYASSAEARDVGLARAEEAFHRALALNPDLALCHSFYAQLMIDTGRADAAMQRLIECLARCPTDPELYVGLVHALRYCGLIEKSVAAHRRARQLDPAIPTSVHHTWWMAGEYERALDETFGDIGYMQGLALASLGREADAIAALRWRERETTEGSIRPYLHSLCALLEGDRAGSLAAVRSALPTLRDAEAIYYMARTLVRLDEYEQAVVELARVVRGGFWCHQVFVRDPWLAPVRERPEVRAIIDDARARMERARVMFVQAGGDRWLFNT